MCLFLVLCMWTSVSKININQSVNLSISAYLISTVSSVLEMYYFWCVVLYCYRWMINTWRHTACTSRHLHQHHGQQQQQQVQVTATVTTSDWLRKIDRSSYTASGVFVAVLYYSLSHFERLLAFGARAGGSWYSMSTCSEATEMCGGRRTKIGYTLF